jgi:hypothetical protein
MAMPERFAANRDVNAARSARRVEISVTTAVV